MKTFPRTVLALVTIVSCAAGVLAPAVAENTPPPAAARFYPFVGKWTGNGELGSPGQPPAKLALRLNCRKASAGWAVLCELDATNKEMSIQETDLFGVDPVTGKGHWYAISNQGETHDHVADWPDTKTMKASTTWTHEGKRMEENITFHFTSSRSMEFRGIVSENGKEVGAFTGKLKR